MSIKWVHILLNLLTFFIPMDMCIIIGQYIQHVRFLFLILPYLSLTNSYSCGNPVRHRPEQHAGRSRDRKGERSDSAWNASKSQSFTLTADLQMKYQSIVRFAVFLYVLYFEIVVWYPWIVWVYVLCKQNGETFFFVHSLSYERVTLRISHRIDNFHKMLPHLCFFTN